MQDAFAVRRMTCCSAFAANKNWHKILSGRQTPSLLLCCGNTCRQEPSASEARGRGMFKRCDNKKRRPRQEAEDLLLTMRLDGHQVKIAYTAEPCCRSHCTPYSIFRQLFALSDHSPIFRMTGGSARAHLVAISICSYRQALEGHRSRGSCRYAAKKQEPK